MIASDQIGSLRRARILLALAASLLLLTGCFPNVAWLPDGSGIVFTEKDGARLVHHDFPSKERRVLCEDTQTRTAWPAVSPDGKRIAVAYWLREKDQPDRLQIILYRLGGTEEWRSTSFKMESSQMQSPDKGETYLVWGHGNRLLVASRHLAWYDIQKDCLIPVADGTPYPSGVSAIRPDGLGFLALRDKSKDSEAMFAFVDLAGKVHPIPGRVTLGDELIHQYGLRWEKQVAILSGPRSTLRLDTEKRTLRAGPAEIAAPLATKDSLEALHVFPGAKAILCVYACKEIRAGNEVKFHRLEWQAPAAKKRQVLVPECEALPIIFPSPDRKRAAIRFAPAKEKQQILVVDASGATVALIDVKE